MADENFIFFCYFSGKRQNSFFIHAFPKRADFFPLFLEKLSPIFVQAGYLSPIATSKGAIII